MNVLIVEDHELLAGTMAMALRQQGFDVHAAAGPSPDDVVAYLEWCRRFRRVGYPRRS